MGLMTSKNNLIIMCWNRNLRKYKDLMKLSFKISQYGSVWKGEMA
jgi:hypothetical protein